MLDVPGSVSKKILLLALMLCGGLAFVLFAGGKSALPFRRSAPSGPSSIAAGQGRLHFDGLYQGTSRNSDQLFLRFYSAGDVVVLSLRGTTTGEVAGMINRDRQELGRGLYHLQKANVAFTTSALNGFIDYEGTVGPDGMVLSIRSHIIDFSDTVKFSFHPTSFPSN